MTKRTSFGFILLFVLVIPLLAVNIWWAISINKLSSQRSQIKDDYSEVNSIEYGLLSVNAWRDNLQFIVSNKITDFDLSAGQEDTLRAQIADVLNTMITEANRMVQNQQSIGGKIKKIAVNTFVNWDDLRKKVPAFTQTILDEIEKPENKDKMKELVNSKLSEYAAQTYATTTDTSKMYVILTKYNAANIDDFNSKTAGVIAGLNNKTYTVSFFIMGTMLLFLLLWVVIFKYPALRQPFFILSVLFALLLLVVSLSTPMIEIDARIKKLDFLLMGEHLQFNDQVIFFRSKSILDVVRILLATGKIDSILVGVLILAFSILFPLAKLICTEIYLLAKKKTAENKIIHFFVFKSGKWSMADVMVVAIFMAYVGFKGILTNQLKDLNLQTESFTSIATNLTSLQPGFLLFLSFVIYGLVLSEILKRVSIRRT